MIKKLKSANFISEHSGVWILIALSATTFFSQITNFYGEDIVNARNNYVTGDRLDFWGGISTLVYSHIPNFLFRWQILLAFTQITFASIGLNKIFFKRKFHGKSRYLIFIATYSALLFASQMTRDGLMFSLLVLGYGLFQEALSQNRIKFTILSIFIILFGLSFRPWISAAMIPIILFSFKNFRQNVTKLTSLLISLIILIAPYCIDLAASSGLKLDRSYPEQQVILMDAAAGYCYSNNISTGNYAKKILSNFSSDQNFDNYLCQMYRPDTWESLIKSNNVSSANIDSQFKLIKPEHETQYQNVKSNWIHMILSDPISYTQNKILFIGKLSVGSDMRRISFLSATSFGEKINSLYKLPFDVAVSLHLYSLFSVATFLVFSSLQVTRRNRRKELVGLYFDRLSLTLITSLALWLVASSVAYIGSNGRYMYSITLLTLIIYASLKGKSTMIGNSDGE